MDQGLIFVIGVLLGALGSSLLIWLLLVLDTDAADSISAYWSRLGGRLARDSAQGLPVNAKEHVSQRANSQVAVEQPRPGCGSSGRGL